MTHFVKDLCGLLLKPGNVAVAFAKTQSIKHVLVFCVDIGDKTMSCPINKLFLVLLNYYQYAVLVIIVPHNFKYIWMHL